MKNTTTTEDKMNSKAEEKKYDEINNDGGEGYNPHRSNWAPMAEPAEKKAPENTEYPNHYVPLSELKKIKEPVDLNGLKWI